MRFHAANVDVRAENRGMLALLLGALSFEAIALYLNFLRDAGGGMLRYGAAIYGLEPLWFIPDLFSIFCVFLFLYRAIVGGNMPAILFTIYVFCSLLLGYVFLGTFTALFSSFKLIAPLFVGLCFANHSLGRHDLLIRLLTILLYVSIVGIVVSKFVQVPWIGFAFETFGKERSASTLWWSHNEQRLPGFASDSTFAAFSVLSLFVVASFKRGLAWCLVVGCVSLYAISLTTSKTSLGVCLLFIVVLAVLRSLPAAHGRQIFRQICIASFAAPFVPLLMMAILSGADLASRSPFLFSLQDRINNSWQLPFRYLYELMPEALFFGCGVGCFNYPQRLFSDLSPYWVPVDNFYIGTYLMFGAPFMVFMVFVFMAMLRERDPYKLAFAFVMNVFTVTILSYNPSSGLILIGISFSTVFATSGGVARRRKAVRPSPIFGRGTGTEPVAQREFAVPS